jgi:hypothetical protein
MGRKYDTARCVVTSVRGEAVPGREKGGDDISWADVNLSRPKNEKKLRCRFSCNK